MGNYIEIIGKTNRENDREVIGKQIWRTYGKQAGNYMEIIGPKIGKTNRENNGEVIGKK